MFSTIKPFVSTMFVAAACLTGIHARAYTLKGEIRNRFNDTPLFGAMAHIYDAEADSLVAEGEALSVIYINCDIYK